MYAFQSQYYTLVAERTSNFCLARKLTWLLVSSDIFTQWGWLILFCLDLSWAIQRRRKSANLSIPQQPLSRMDVFLSTPFNSSSFITPWGEPSNSWAFESTLLDQRFPVEYEFDEYITPLTNSNYWQHAKCLHHGLCIYAEYILHCYRTLNYWRNAKMPAWPFYTCFLSYNDDQHNSNFMKLLIKNLTASLFLSFIFLPI